MVGDESQAIAARFTLALGTLNSLNPETLMLCRNVRLGRIVGRAIFYLVFALPTAGVGGFMMLRSLGVFGPIATSADGPAWLGVVIGFVFFAGGASVVLKLFFGGADLQRSDLPPEAPAIVRILYNGLGLGIVVGLGALFAWVAFGSGERHFSGSGAFLGPFVGRAMFGLAAFLTCLALVWMAIRWLKRRG